MGVDVHDVQNITHFGACEDTTMYVRAIGRASRDGGSSTALLLLQKENMQHVNIQMKMY